MRKFNTLEEVFEYYGRGNLVAVGNIKQIIHYTTNGCQPEFVFESRSRQRENYSVVSQRENKRRL